MTMVLENVIATPRYVAEETLKPSIRRIKKPLVDVNINCVSPAISEIFPIFRIWEILRLSPTRNKRNTTPNFASVLNVSSCPPIVCKKRGPAIIPEIIYAIMSGCLRSRMTNAMDTVRPNKMAS